LRRRGIPAEAINLFVCKVGVTMAQTVIDPSMLDSCVRDVLNVMAHRAMAVFDPIKVVITNFEGEKVMIDVPNIPNDEKAGQHKVPFDRVVYIERSDFREKADKDYKRLAVDQTVGLRHAGKVLTVTKVIKDNKGEVSELHVTCESSTAAAKPKAFIQWVSDPIECEIRIYDRLFKHPNPENPAEVPGGFLSDINENSLQVIERAFVDTSVKNAAPLSKFQFERIGFFAVDPSSTKDQLIFNRTVPLREDAAKN